MHFGRQSPIWKPLGPKLYAPEALTPSPKLQGPEPDTYTPIPKFQGISEPEDSKPQARNRKAVHISHITMSPVWFLLYSVCIYILCVYTYIYITFIYAICAYKQILINTVHSTHPLQRILSMVWTLAAKARGRLPVQHARGQRR